MDFKKELEFLGLAEKLKKEMRHCWYDDGRRESVAEHSWRLALMVFRYAHQIDQPVDLYRTLKMALVHDLPEAIAGDLPVPHQNASTKQLQFEKEKMAIEKIAVLLGDANAQEMKDLWYEYEEQRSYESRFLKALDKLEAFIQHNEAPLKSWELKDKQMLFHDRFLMDHCKFDSFLAKFAQRVLEEGMQKLKEGGEDLSQIRDSVWVN